MKMNKIWLCVLVSTVAFLLGNTAAAQGGGCLGTITQYVPCDGPAAVITTAIPSISACPGA